MDYKKVFRSRQLRFRILKMLSFVPDATMLKWQYRIKTGRKLNLKNPQRFTEKLQLYKMYYRNPALPVCVDKYAVRGYIEQLGLGSLLNNLYAVCDRAEDIDFEQLPNRFVVKTTDGSGGNNILICRDKSQLDIPAAIARINSWLDTKSVNAGREWAYTGIDRSRIVVEEFLENEANPQADLEDFKFFCFDGKPVYCQVIGNRTTDETIDFFDMEFKHIDGLVGLNIKTHNSKTPISRPQKWNEMKEVAQILASGFPFVRVDLYNIGQRIIFGELTFYPASGYGHFSFDEFDYELGALFDTSSFTKPKH